ncbi:MAG TPA: (2Fe-2S)-binding protein [Streptosporangiaceae bacterium]|nr:(2Fe-2S)-binding protein [Streptosporangiaceae bacterium]
MDEDRAGTGRDPLDAGDRAWRAAPGTVIAALADAATLGEYFRMAPGGAGPTWRRADEAYRHGMRDLVAHTAAALGVVPGRVAVSIAQLGYASRLWSPSLACALKHGIVPDLRGLQISKDIPVRLRLPRPGGWHPATPDLAARLLYRMVVEEHLEPFAAGLDARPAAGLLRGNSASAIAGALGVIVRASPELAASARQLADLLLGTGRLRGTGGFAGPDLNFGRRSCCLYYRVPYGTLCGDCSLLSPPGTRRREPGG